MRMEKESRWGNKQRLFLVLCAFFFTCTGESEKFIEEKLRFILDDDLKTIITEVRQKDTTAVLSKPYYRIESYDQFTNSRMYSHKAVVHFYYLKSIKMMQIRKYRYSPTMGQWQRYYKKLDYDLE
jgi:hypothetical protein